MRVSYQRGHLRCVNRKDGPSRWEFLWRENDPLGHRIRRNTVIGTLDQYPTEELALEWSRDCECKLMRCETVNVNNPFSSPI